MFILMKGNKAVSNPWLSDGSHVVGSFQDCVEALKYLVEGWGADPHLYLIYEMTKVD